ncbi:HEPN domain-containing protein [Paenibacillus radicis (ex Gao et al. 2016)]|uniref:Apea-like HEPN domain-containing protein n=1 Tax=Paenibacillus radicis (ex Gao et al. 2016) TaxID=1737354 RepID=A0A917M7A1_9BACL|nr:HEPN domain-containing protein [Paenibacillus radicis (ex Gao et al. 2016)]GGG82066.1 hypothetical protein GCM10010918_44250 [Paenibacillus radicis (ex Gao et al. 2016)]
MYKVEYLILTKQEGSFCDSAITFIKLLEVDSSISIEGSNITYQSNNISVKAIYKLKTGEISEKKERYFHLEVESISSEDLDNFSSLITKLKEILLRISPNNTKVNTLWDDIGREYAIKAYPLINETENLMRKLISQFMLINVGMDWSAEEIHDEIKEKIQRYEQQESYVDDLYKTDFIHLSDVLFKKYRTLSVEQMNRLLSGMRKSEDLDISILRKFIPQSNWEKHFDSKIKYDDKKLKDKWHLLYTLRNNIAHNRFISKEDFQKINGLVNELNKIIITSIKKLDVIKLETQEKEEVKLSYKPNSMAYMGFIAEKAVADWYLTRSNVKSIIPTSDGIDVGYDFILEFATDSQEKIAVITKTRRHRSIFSDLRLSIKKAEYQLISNFSEIHLVLVINDYSPEMHINTRKLDELRIHTKVSIIIGFINKKGFFNPLEI